MPNSMFAHSIFRHLCLGLIFFCQSALAQETLTIQGRVVDGKTQEPLPFVNITVEGSHKGTTTNLDGYYALRLTSEPQALRFSYIGYKSRLIEAPMASLNAQGQLNVSLEEDLTVLQTVDLVAGENPAHRIVNAAINAREKHRPESYPSFTYRSYNKFLVTVNPDSLVVPDTLLTANDTAKAQVKEFLDNKHIFIMESVSERKFLDEKRDSEEVLATRVSGFENPNFAMLATEFQSLSFYHDYITVFNKDYLSPLSKGATKKYFFLLKDTLYRGKDSIFVVQFEPRRNTNFEGLKGAVYITSDGYALTNVLAKPAAEQSIAVEVQQQYKKTSSGYWFPYQLNADFVFKNVSLNGLTPIGISRSYLKDIAVGADLNKKDISRVDLVIQEDAAKKEEKFWEQYREDTLDQKERATYVFIDSLSKAENLENKLKLYTAALTGKWVVGPVAIDLDRLVFYNSYEGWRLGLGAHTSTNFSEWFTLGGYLAYGFRDQAWKQGADVDFRLNKFWNWHVGFAYMNDVLESGRIDVSDERSMFGLNEVRNFYVGINRDKIRKYSLYNTIDLLPNLSWRSSFNVEDFIRVEPYSFMGDQTSPGTVVYPYMNIVNELQFNPNKRVIQTQNGRMSLNTSYPEYKAFYEYGFDTFGTGRYSRLAFRFQHNYRLRGLGKQSVRITTGKVFGKVAYPKLNTIPGNAVDGFSVNSHFSFETMGVFEFAASEYILIQFYHDFGSLLFSRPKFKPELKVVHNMAWGGFEHRQLHEIERKTPEQGYFESGLEINKIFSTLGLGLYYRYGPYAYSSVGENLFVKMTLSLPF